MDGKYAKLYEHLVSRPGLSWTAPFRDIEAILGFALPRSASEFPAWWANQRGKGHSQANAWREAGWRTRNLDLAGKHVEFERVGRVETQLASAEEELFIRARDYTGIDDRDELVREGIRALIQREAGRRLAKLGGAMPDFSAPPPRRRADEA